MIRCGQIRTPIGLVRERLGDSGRFGGTSCRTAPDSSHAGSGRYSRGGRPTMSITEIASTGLLRVVAPAAAETSATDVPDHALRAVALATLASSAGMLRPSRNQLPSRAVKATARTPKRNKL